MTLNHPIIVSLLIIVTRFIIISAQSFQRPPSPNEVLCGITEGPPVCTAVYDPVCVPSPKQCYTTPCYQFDDIPSRCLACSMPGVFSYIPGPCQFRCEPINLPPPNSGLFEGPVCAYYLPNCNHSLCRKTFETSTTACKNSGVLFFSFGLCPEDSPDNEGSISGEVTEENLLEEETIFEETQNLEEEHVLEEELYMEETHEVSEVIEATLYCTKRPVNCSNTVHPVCTTDCFDGKCRKTVSSACNACKDTNVLAYTPGACELQRLDCPFFNSPTTNILCTSEFYPVCGYSIDCKQEPCGRTARNACEACIFLQKDYYTIGVCQ